MCVLPQTLPILRYVSTPPFIDLPEHADEAGFPTAQGLLPALDSRRAGSRGVALLVPGFTGSKEDFIALIDPLADLGWGAVALDLPGQGGAPITEEVSLDSLAAAVAEVIRAVDPGAGVHVVGHSFGGLVTRAAILDKVEAASVASWTALCSGPAALPDSQHENLIRFTAALERMGMDQIWTIREAMDRAAGWAPPSESVLAFMRRRFSTTSPRLIHEMAHVLMTAVDRTEELAAVPLPKVVMFGENDDAWPTEGQRDMADRLGCPVVSIAGSGHSPAADQPIATAAALDDFWRTHAAPASAG